MLVAFVESIKYVGHLLPIAFLRIFLGYFYLNQAMNRLQGEFLERPYLAEGIRDHLPKSQAPLWYQSFLETVVVPNWHLFAISLIVIQFALGVSYLLGYLVRPFAFIAIVFGLGLIAALGPNYGEGLTTMTLVVHFTLGWLGAGRCLGIDYYFYKRRRGIWW